MTCYPTAACTQAKPPVGRHEITMSFKSSPAPHSAEGPRERGRDKREFYCGGGSPSTPPHAPGTAKIQPGIGEEEAGLRHTKCRRTLSVVHPHPEPFLTLNQPQKPPREENPPSREAKQAAAPAGKATAGRVSNQLSQSPGSTSSKPPALSSDRRRPTKPRLQKAPSHLCQPTHHTPSPAPSRVAVIITRFRRLQALFGSTLNRV